MQLKMAVMAHELKGPILISHTELAKSINSQQPLLPPMLSSFLRGWKGTKQLQLTQRPSAQQEQSSSKPLLPLHLNRQCPETVSPGRA